MSFLNAKAPECDKLHCPQDVEMSLIPRSVDLGGFNVSRVLPCAEKRMVGPFVFWDQFGRSEFLKGQGVDVRPHPHIGLATLTYLFDGSLVHRDNLGSHQVIMPGDVNLMVAGCGIAHSERTSVDVRQHPHVLFGLQIWLALPHAKEEMVPSFAHYPRNELKKDEADGAQIHVVAGNFHGLGSNVETVSDAMLVDVQLKEGASVVFSKEYEERAVHLVSGEIQLYGKTYSTPQMLVLKPNHDVTIQADTDAKIILLGGAALDGPRHVWWNFVSSSKDRIEQAKQDWLAGRFAKIPGDEDEYIPLPE